MTGPAKSWRLREVVAADSDALALVGAATFLDAFAGTLDKDAIVAHCKREHSRTAYETYLADGCRAWLAEHEQGGAPVGFAMTGSPSLACAQPRDLELKRIYILSRYHGLGLGAALMQAVIAASQDFQRLILGVYAENNRAIAFYRKQAFEPVGTRQFDVGGTLYDDVVLARPISPDTQ